MKSNFNTNVIYVKQIKHDLIVILTFQSLDVNLNQ